MTGSDYAAARFIPDGAGDVKFNRDWDQHPPTPREVEVLLAYGQLTSDLLTTFMEMWAAGVVAAAEGLAEDEQRALTNYLIVVGRVATTTDAAVRGEHP